MPHILPISPHNARMLPHAHDAAHLPGSPTTSFAFSLFLTSRYGPRWLYPDIETTVKLRTVTIDEEGAGFDGQVFVTISDGWSTSSEMQLVNEQGGAAFKRGSAAEFTLTVTGFAYIDKVGGADTLMAHKPLVSECAGTQLGRRR